MCKGHSGVNISILPEHPYRLLTRMVLPLSLLSLFVGCGGKKDQPRGSGGGQPLPVEVQLVQPRFLENRIFTTGTLLANEEVELRSEISGRVTAVNFAEGRSVSKGDLLLKINDRELKAQYTQKELEEKLAAQEERRSRQLFDIKGISQEEYDRVLNNLQLIQAEKDEIGAQLAKTEITAPFDGIVGLRYVSEGGVCFAQHAGGHDTGCRSDQS